MKWSCISESNSRSSYYDQLVFSYCLLFRWTDWYAEDRYQLLTYLQYVFEKGLTTCFLKLKPMQRLQLVSQYLPHLHSRMDGKVPASLIASGGQWYINRGCETFKKLLQKGTQLWHVTFWHFPFHTILWWEKLSLSSVSCSSRFFVFFLILRVCLLKLGQWNKEELMTEATGESLGRAALAL